MVQFPKKCYYLVQTWNCVTFTSFTPWWNTWMWHENYLISIYKINILNNPRPSMHASFKYLSKWCSAEMTTASAVFRVKTSVSKTNNSMFYRPYKEFLILVFVSSCVAQGIVRKITYHMGHIEKYLCTYCNALLILVVLVLLVLLVRAWIANNFYVFFTLVIHSLPE